MKRTAHACFVGVGQQRPVFADKHATWGAALTKAEVIAAQLRGEPDLSGELYGKRAIKCSVVNEQRARGAA